MIKKGSLSEAEQRHQQALTIYLQQGQETLQVAACLNDLGMVYRKRERFLEAETVYLRSLAIREKLLGANDPLISESLNNIAVVYRFQGKYPQEACSYYQKAIEICERRLGPDHPHTKISKTSYEN